MLVTSEVQQHAFEDGGCDETLDVHGKVDENDGLCAVCHDKAAGIHYNVMSCFGCKTFFRRAIINSRRYFCEKFNKCDVSQRSGRQSCKSCRLQKCFAVGMKMRCLRSKRDRTYKQSVDKPAKSHHLPNEGSSITPNDLLEPSTSHSVDKTDQMLFNFVTNLTKTDVELRKKKQKWLMTLEAVKTLHKEVQEYPNHNKNAIIRMADKTDMATVTSAELYCLIDWAKKLPFFTKLNLMTQTSILQRFSVFHIIIEFGHFTAKSKAENMWILSNGSVLPKDVDSLPVGSKALVSEGRAWRQDKLYRQMTESCIDEVAEPMKKLNLMAEELLTLKVIMFCQCGLRVNDKTPEDIEILNQSINKIIKALFVYYQKIHVQHFEERFGNILLLISGIVAAAAPTLESYRIQSLFDFVPFDKIAKSLLFRQNDVL
ncbi:unnamed protein product [Bursaphelenchus okinawaensis]|uniref:Nuclear receptor domain-containing protein n=1 Tax=Bursaphelenchus okinawaensis TaxID=465554 RepID=A0A811LMR3_9BILA|nr:unnamed protein product [Bursaphelenchus okinawaensis]CAG9128202.1 unnamed protein product [Bursaphelenchus okinawaensis]